MELNKRELSSLIEAYMSLGTILGESLDGIEPDSVKGIKGNIHKLTIHSNYFKHVAQSLYHKLENPPPEQPEAPEEQKIDPAHCDHVWEMGIGTCEKCGIDKLEWEAGHAGRQEESDDSSARIGPEENG